MLSLMNDTITIAEAQREVREVYVGGFHGGLVAGAIWLAAAGVGTWGTPRTAMLVLIFAGMFIFPLTQLLLTLSGRRASLSDGNPMRFLAMQIAFTVPLSIPLVLAASMRRPEWFFPAFMLVVGAHYLPFMFLYGMWQYGVLGTLMIGGGFLLATSGAGFAVGGWITGVLLVAFAFIGRTAVTSAGAVLPFSPREHHP